MPYLLIRTMKNLTDKELQAEIDKISNIIDKSTSKYQKNDLTKYLRRLQKERYLRRKQKETK